MFSRPAKNNTTTTSSKEVTKANNAPEITPGMIKGKVIFIKVFTGLLPTLAAALVKDELNESILAVITSKRTDIYSQAFKANNVPISEPSALALEKLSDYYRTHCCTDEYWTLVGDAQGIVAPHLIEAGWKVKKSSIISPDAETLARLAEARWKPGSCYLPPTPHYLRPADAIIPKNSGRLRS